MSASSNGSDTVVRSRSPPGRSALAHVPRPTPPPTRARPRFAPNLGDHAASAEFTQHLCTCGHRNRVGQRLHARPGDHDPREATGSAIRSQRAKRTTADEVFSVEVDRPIEPQLERIGVVPGVRPVGEQHILDSFGRIRYPGSDPVMSAGLFDPRPESTRPTWVVEEDLEAALRTPARSSDHDGQTVDRRSANRQRFHSVHVDIEVAHHRVGSRPLDRNGCSVEFGDQAIRSTLGGQGLDPQADVAVSSRESPVVGTEMQQNGIVDEDAVLIDHRSVGTFIDTHGRGVDRCGVLDESVGTWPAHRDVSLRRDVPHRHRLGEASILGVRVAVAHR